MTTTTWHSFWMHGLGNCPVMEKCWSTHVVALWSHRRTEQETVSARERNVPVAAHWCYGNDMRATQSNRFWPYSSTLFRNSGICRQFCGYRIQEEEKETSQVVHTRWPKVLEKGGMDGCIGNVKELNKITTSILGFLYPYYWSGEWFVSVKG